MRFDVPVIGAAHDRSDARAGATCLAIEAGRTLLFDRAAIVDAAEHSGHRHLRPADKPVPPAAWRAAYYNR